MNNHDQVFTEFHQLSHQLGGIDTVIVNAGISARSLHLKYAFYRLKA